MYEPIHLERWSPEGPTAFDSRQNYMGADLSGWYIAAGTNRDADVLVRSNWECICRDLLPLSTDIEGDENSGQSVFVASFGHWACGWYELLLIHATNDKALEKADEIQAALSDYPVYDESHFSELDWNQYIRRSP